MTETTDDEPDVTNDAAYRLDGPITWAKFDASEMRWGVVDARVYDFKKAAWLPPVPDGFAYDLGEEKLVPLSEIPDDIWPSEDDWADD